MKFRDLESVRVIIKDATNLEITYAYEDLVFPDNMAFLIQFDDNNQNNFFFHFNAECNLDEKQAIFEQLKKVAIENKKSMEQKGAFTLEQKNEEVEIRFVAA